MLHPVTAAALVDLGGEDPHLAEGLLGIFRAVGFDDWIALGERYR
ncbi:hypothetical protein [Streptomyces canus]|nr:hypothetical protein [Streptomyces canus]